MCDGETKLGGDGDIFIFGDGDGVRMAMSGVGAKSAFLNCVCVCVYWKSAMSHFHPKSRPGEKKCVGTLPD